MPFAPPNPRLVPTQTFSAEANLEPTLALLESRLGLNSEELRRVVVGRPTALGSIVEAKLGATLDFLEERLGLDAVQLKKVVVGRPQLLGLSVEGNLAPTLEFYQTALGMDDRAVAGFVGSSPALLSYSLSGRLVPRLQRCREAGVDMNPRAMKTVAKASNAKFDVWLKEKRGGVEAQERQQSLYMV